MTGDTAAALISDEASLVRSIGMFFIGSTLYATEIRAYFSWIEKRVNTMSGFRKTISKTLMAIIYFNPLWIARHLCFVYLLSGRADLITFHIAGVALIAFAVNIPVSIIGNYLIQNKIHLEYRFWSSAAFSGLMAVYYSMSSVWF